MIKIGFFGTPSLSAAVLQGLLHDSRFEVVFAVTNPDTPFGRSQELRSTPVRALAESHDIPVFTPTKIRDNTELLDQLRQFPCDYFIVVAYGRILPESILSLPSQLSLNVHGSVLPRYRGASPIQSALLHGDKETGVTIMVMSAGMDEGDILSITPISIDPHDTAGSLFEKFANVSPGALIDTIVAHSSGRITPEPQNHTDATYCKKINKEDGLVDWSTSATEIYQHWQAYTPWPGVFAQYLGKRLLLEQISVSHTPHEGKIGQVVSLADGTIGVICTQGVLTIHQVKLEGKKSQFIKDFVNGNQQFISYQL